MTRSLPVASLAIALLFVACSAEDKQPAASAPSTSESPATAPSFDPTQLPSEPAAAVIMDPNPAHGEPGHRCEIPVGASLSSAPAAGADPTMINTSPMINMEQPSSGTPVVTAAGMNPPHGEPGHDCAVPVGSPLPK